VIEKAENEVILEPTAGQPEAERRSEPQKSHLIIQLDNLFIVDAESLECSAFQLFKASVFHTAFR